VTAALPAAHSALVDRSATNIKIIIKKLTHA